MLVEEQDRLRREWMEEGRERIGRNFGELEPECKRLQRGQIVSNSVQQLSMIVVNVHTVGIGITSGSRWRGWRLRAGRSGPAHHFGRLCCVFWAVEMGLSRNYDATKANELLQSVSFFCQLPLDALMMGGL